MTNSPPICHIMKTAYTASARLMRGRRIIALHIKITSTPASTTELGMSEVINKVVSDAIPIIAAHSTC